jgi:chorismate synthase
MVLVQNFDEHNVTGGQQSCKLGNGIYLSPWTGGSYSNSYYRHNKNGEGIADIFKAGLNFFKNNSGAIADAASAAGGIANVMKTVKDIKRADEELYELKRIKDEVAAKKQEPTFTKAQLEIMDKIRKTGDTTGGTTTTGNGIKVL